jgi:hypothetical protein
MHDAISGPNTLGIHSSMQMLKSNVGARAKAERCVSLVSKGHGELNLEAGSKMQLTAWLFGVHTSSSS